MMERLAADSGHEEHEYEKHLSNLFHILQLSSYGRRKKGAPNVPRLVVRYSDQNLRPAPSSFGTARQFRPRL